ncbi:MFS transporter [Actinoallomurus sp. NBC_01490]|uniref:MFS transporter n=1 Tax=Actinoallomurus sp. NBC_01490 TaxID=2903557 RepID=UPI002E34CE87|nr:MFS transporter [Actinoallomurus sp. NBC_01490]
MNSVGTGMFITSSALYFTGIVGLSAAQVGVGLTVAGFVALSANLSVGRLADGWGARGVWAASLGIEASAMAAFLVARSFWAFLVVACVSQFAAAASQTARLPVFRMVGGDSATHLRSVIRTIVNLASSFGALVAGVAIYFDVAPAYYTLISANALTFAANVFIVLKLPKVARTPQRARRRSDAALKNFPFLLVTLLNSVLILQAPVFTFALPLWIESSTDAPPSLFAVLVVLNTAVVTLFQIRAARGVDGVTIAGRVMRTSGFGLAVSFLAIGASSLLGTVGAVVVLIASMTLLSFAEIRYAAAEFELSFGLAPKELQGEYGGVFTLGLGLATSAGPYLLAVGVLSTGLVGWVALAIVVSVASLFVPHAVGMADQRLKAMKLEAFQ